MRDIADAATTYRSSIGIAVGMHEFDVVIEPVLHAYCKRRSRSATGLRI